MAISIEITGTDRTEYLGKNSLRIRKGLGNKSTLNTHFNCKAGTWIPRLGQDVKVYDGATLLFGGVIDQINTQSLEPQKGGAAYIQVNISSNGYGKIPARRTASVYFTDTSCGDIFNNLVVNGLNNATFNENVTVGSITSGITLPRYSAVCKSFKEVFDELAEQSGVQWYIDDTKTINFVQEATVTTASHTLDESGSFTDYIIMGTSSDLQNYCNKVFVRGDNDSLFSIVTDTAEITARLSAEGTAYSSGVYGRIINAPDVTTETALSTIGDNALKRYGFEPIELKVRSFTSTWTVGTKIQCYLPKYDITANTEFLIEELNISRYDTDILAYDMTLTKRKTADFSSQKVERGKEFFEQIIKKANRGSSGTGGFGTGSTGTIDHYQDTTTATATVTTSETTLTSKAFDLSVPSDIHMTFSAYLQVTAAVTVTGRTYLNEGTAVTTTLTFQPQQNLSGNETFAFCDFYEAVSAGTTTMTVKLVSDTGTITVNTGQAAMNILVFPRDLTATYTAVVTGDGFLYGGSDGSALADCEQYAPDTNAWANKTDNAVAIYQAAASTISGKGYAYGGNGPTLRCDEYDATGDAWTNKTNMPANARDTLAASTIGIKGYAYCGYAGVVWGYTQDCDEFDAAGNSWASKTDSPAPGRRYLAGSTISEKGYVYGGNSGVAFLGDCDEFDATGNSWASKTDMPAPTRYQFAASSIGGKGYVYGGTNFGAKQDCDEFDAAGNSWANKTDMPVPARIALAALTIREKGYAVAGYDDSNLLQDCDEYDATGNSWASKTDTPLPARQFPVASTI